MSEILKNIRHETLELIDTKYGDGHGSAGEKPLAYHNGAHTRRGLQDVELLSSCLGLTAEEREIALTAFTFHDFVHHEGDDELLSANAYEEAVREAVNPFYVNAGKLCILGTKVSFEKSTIVQQATAQLYPSERAKLMAHAVAAADVGVLFTPEGPLWSHRLMREMYGPEPTTAQMLAFQRGQIAFLLNYEYPRRDIERALATHKPEVVSYIAKVLVELEQGNITSAEQLLESDFVFKASCS